MSAEQSQNDDEYVNDGAAGEAPTLDADGNETGAGDAAEDVASDGDPTQTLDVATTQALVDVARSRTGGSQVEDRFTKMKDAIKPQSAFLAPDLLRRFLPVTMAFMETAVPKPGAQMRRTVVECPSAAYAKTLPLRAPVRVYERVLLVPDAAQSREVFGAVVAYPGVAPQDDGRVQPVAVGAKHVPAKATVPAGSAAVVVTHEQNGKAKFAFCGVRLVTITLEDLIARLKQQIAANETLSAQTTVSEAQRTAATRVAQKMRDTFTSLDASYHAKSLTPDSTTLTLHEYTVLDSATLSATYKTVADSQKDSIDAVKNACTVRLLIPPTDVNIGGKSQHVDEIAIDLIGLPYVPAAALGGPVEPAPKKVKAAPADTAAAIKTATNSKAPPTPKPDKIVAIIAETDTGVVPAALENAGKKPKKAVARKRANGDDGADEQPADGDEAAATPAKKAKTVEDVEPAKQAKALTKKTADAEPVAKKTATDDDDNDDAEEQSAKKAPTDDDDGDAAVAEPVAKKSKTPAKTADDGEPAAKKPKAVKIDDDDAVADEEVAKKPKAVAKKAATDDAESAVKKSKAPAKKTETDDDDGDAAAEPVAKKSKAPAKKTATDDDGDAATESAAKKSKAPAKKAATDDGDAATESAAKKSKAPAKKAATDDDDGDAVTEPVAKKSKAPAKKAATDDDDGDAAAEPVAKKSKAPAKKAATDDADVEVIATPVKKSTNVAATAVAKAMTKQTVPAILAEKLNKWRCMEANDPSRTRNIVKNLNMPALTVEALLSGDPAHALRVSNMVITCATMAAAMGLANFDELVHYAVEKTSLLPEPVDEPLIL